jgi:hypothetical protein
LQSDPLPLPLNQNLNLLLQNKISHFTVDGTVILNEAKNLLS